jgi:hypothetical protein
VVEGRKLLSKTNDYTVKLQAKGRSKGYKDYFTRR